MMAALNLRLSTPEVLIDITGLTELSGIRVVGDRLRIGALTRHAELLASARAGESRSPGRPAGGASRRRTFSSVSTKRRCSQARW